MRKPVFGFPTRTNTNRAVQPHKLAGGLKFRIWEVEGLYYPCSENKGAYQLRGSDLCLCFRICKKTVFSRQGSYTPSKDSDLSLLTNEVFKKYAVFLLTPKNIQTLHDI